MAKHVELHPVHPFTTEDETSIGQRWEKWKKSLEYYLTASGLTDDKQKRGLLLHLGGEEVQDVWDSLEETGEDYESAIKALDTYFSPQKNVIYERHIFRQLAQQSDETIDSFVTRLKMHVKHCDYDKYSNDEAIRDQIIDKCISKKLRRRLLCESELTLQTAKKIARSMETSDKQAKTMENDQLSTAVVNVVKHKPEQHHPDSRVEPMTNVNAEQETASVMRLQTYTKRKFQPPQKKPRSGCYGCGSYNHFHGDSHCPALGQTCENCGKVNHFARVCRSKRQSRQTQLPHQPRSHHIRFADAEADSSDEDFAYVFAVHPSMDKEALVTVQLDNVPVKMMIDSGATINILDKSTYNKTLAKSHPSLYHINTKIYTYGANDPLPVRGAFNTAIRYKDRSTLTKVIVADSPNAGALLSRETAMALGLLHIGPKAENDITLALRTKFPEVFDGVGKLKDFQLQIHVDDSVQPVIQAQQRMAYQVRDKVAEKVDELLRMDIIEPVKGPSKWVSPLVAVPKANGDIRICVDMRRPNEAIRRTRYPIPTVEDTLYKLNGATVFSKIDLKWGYHQIELAEESRDITTFQSPKGLFRFKRLIFGGRNSSEDYQYSIQQALDGCRNVVNISDDIIVFGKSQAEHEVCLMAVMQRLKDKGLTINPDKCLFNAPEITFFGFKVSARGVRAEENKVAAVQHFDEPKNTHEVRSFLGLITYVGRFIPNLATVAEPLRQLTRNNTKFEWGTSQREAFESLKSAISSQQVMAHFNPAANTVLTVDASPFGLGALLAQETGKGLQPVAYASRTLSSVERRYSQTEREALAVVWGCERFHLYLYRKDFVLCSDHKPLEMIYSAKGKPPPRIERWALRLQQYSFVVKHIPGDGNPADLLSRQPIPNSIGENDNYINFIVSNALPKALTLQEVQEASLTDPVLKQVAEDIVNSTIKSQGLAGDFYKVKDELSTKNGLVLRGHRLVIPKKLQRNVLHLAHEGHQGIVKTKQLLRQKVWWPGIDMQVEALIKSCHACQAVSQSAKPEPIISTDMPSKEWDVVHIDVCGPFPSGESILGAIDECSRWPEAIILNKSTSTGAIIKHLLNIFATHGIPSTLVTDNGPQFVSQDFKKFCLEYGIYHRRVTPYWPQANSEIERFFRTLKKTLTAVTVEGKNWKNELFRFLLAYRTTPHSTTGKSPAQLLMHRELRTKIPSIRERIKPRKEIREAMQNDRKHKAQMKIYADRRSGCSDIKRGDNVLLKQQQQHKLMPRFDPKPYEVLRRQGTSVIVRRGEQRLMRNVSHAKKFHGKTTDLELDNESFIEDFEVLANGEHEGAELQAPVQDVEPREIPLHRNVRRSTRATKRPNHLRDYVIDS